MRIVKVIGVLLCLGAIALTGAYLSMENYHAPVISELWILDVETETTAAFVTTTICKTLFYMAVLYFIAVKRMQVFSDEKIRVLSRSVVSILKRKTLLTPVIFQSKFRGIAPLAF